VLLARSAAADVRLHFSGKEFVYYIYGFLAKLASRRNLIQTEWLILIVSLCAGIFSYGNLSAISR
jgi:hypothetical protein